jgi:hypothetical protein|nr:MAG TPA: hypothetical protein [Caudoviricetes sp.]
MYDNNLYKKSDNIRRMIDGELNRIAVTDDAEEIIRMMGYLMLNINRYAEIAKLRIGKDNIRKLSADGKLNL